MSDIRTLSRQLQQVERETKDTLRGVRMVLGRLESGAALASDVPAFLTDLDTTVTGAELNALHAWYAGMPASLNTLGLTVSATFSQSEMQSIVDKLDEMIGVLQSLAIAIAVGVDEYFRPGGVDQYFRPDGISQYKRP